MSVQFLSDQSGKTTGVFIPIEQWNKLKDKFSEIEDMELDIPDWQKEKLEKRLNDYISNPKQVLDSDSTLEEINNAL